MPPKLLLPAALVLCLAVSAMGADAPLPSLRDAIHEHKQWLRINGMDWKRTGARDAQWLDAFLDDFERPGVVVRDESWRKAALIAIMLGKHAHLFYQNTGYIREEPALKIVLSALADPNKELREIAVQTLAGEVYRTDLEPYTHTILPELFAAGKLNDLEWHLYGNLALSAEDRKKVVANPRAPSEVRARCGDTAAENDLLAAFEKEIDFTKMVTLSRQLGYIATDRCAAALAKALASSVAVHGEIDERSIRGEVLLALGKIYQTESLFTVDALFLTQNGDEMFDRYRNKAAYLKDVDAWVQKHFNHLAWGAGEVWFARAFNTPLIAPPVVPPPR